MKCFTEKVIQVQKIDIEFICSSEGAHKTVSDALREALADIVTC